MEIAGQELRRGIAEDELRGVRRERIAKNFQLNWLQRQNCAGGKADYVVEELQREILRRIKEQELGSL